VDFSPNCRDQESADLPFIEMDLTAPMPLREKYGYCIDVMEHIPTGDVDAVVHNIMASAETVFFQISTVNDKMGSLIGQHLHLTVKPHLWWHRLFWMLGYQIAWEQEQDICSSFLVKKKIPH
jgi:hypothetical protein